MTYDPDQMPKPAGIPVDSDDLCSGDKVAVICRDQHNPCPPMSMTVGKIQGGEVWNDEGDVGRHVSGHWFYLLSRPQPAVSRMAEPTNLGATVFSDGAAFSHLSTNTHHKETPMPEPTISLCQEADAIINGDRQDDYGTPLQSFERIAALWSIILDTPVSAEKVVLAMIALKVSRALHGFHRDSFLDIAGYAGCAELIEQERGDREKSGKRCCFGGVSGSD
jgi:hypothetical protein